MGVAADKHGNVFVADTSNNAIKKVTPNGTISEIGHGFHGPESVAVDTGGNVYVADTLNNAVKKVAPDGQITTIASGSEFTFPYRIAVRAGSVYVATVHDRRYGADFLMKVAPNGKMAVVLATDFIGGVALDARGSLYVDGGHCDPQLVSGYLLKHSPSGWTTIKQKLVCPMDVAVDATGSVYFGDAGQVFKLRP